MKPFKGIKKTLAWGCRLGAVALTLLAVVAPAHAADFFDPVGTPDLASCSTLAGWA